MFLHFDHISLLYFKTCSNIPFSKIVEYARNLNCSTFQVAANFNQCFPFYSCNNYLKSAKFANNTLIRNFD